MDAAEALKDLTEISSQIQAAVLVNVNGQTLASTIDDGARSDRLCAAVSALVEAATAQSEGESRLVQLEAATSDGSLVFFDLKSCLRAAAAEHGDGKPRPRAGVRRTRGAAS